MMFTAIMIVLGVLFIGGMYYILLPAFNVQDIVFWIFLALIPTVGMLAAIGTKHAKKMLVWCGTAISILVVFVIGCVIYSSRLFHARAYSEILTVQEGEFDTLPSVSGTESIALMDTASAEKLGNREIGSLSGVVSQYDVSEYTQIDYEGTPVKVSALRYAGFFKYYSNQDSGVPGYVVVNPVSMEADYVALDEGMKYVPSAYFSHDLSRHIRFAYPTVIFGNEHFEIDEEGNPWYIASTYEHTIGLFGGTQVNGIILVNPITGEMQKLSVEEVPQWVDVVFPGDLICDQYNDYAQLQNGFWNSVFGQVGARKVTEYTGADEDSYSDYGYISKDGDIWIYTGVTSLNSDSSNIGFLMSNERTEETIFITCPGADEFSAMAAAEGEVQEKGYEASFPSLILIDGKPTYIMVLKDSGGLVKMYACVNVEQYNIVVTASSQEEVIAKYRSTVGSEEITDEVTDTSDWATVTVTVVTKETIVVEGNTYLYIVDENGNTYHAKYIDVLDMLTVGEGDTVTILTDGTNFVTE